MTTATGFQVDAPGIEAVPTSTVLTPTLRIPLNAPTLRRHHFHRFAVSGLRFYLLPIDQCIPANPEHQCGTLIRPLPAPIKRPSRTENGQS
jgi:hypothetical protein